MAFFSGVVIATSAGVFTIEITGVVEDAGSAEVLVIITSPFLK
jgi:hypothetical protein